MTGRREKEIGKIRKGRKRALSRFISISKWLLVGACLCVTVLIKASKQQEQIIIQSQLGKKNNTDKNREIQKETKT